MIRRTPVVPGHSNAYEIFILVLTLLSLVVVFLLLLPLKQATIDALRFYDNVICLIFLADFAWNLRHSRPRSDYLVGRRGWLDLLGSIPSLGIVPLVVLLRLARLSRLMRVAGVFGRGQRKAIVADIIRNRGQYALFVTILLVMLVLTTSSVLIVEFESGAPGSSVATGGDALWWAFVTLATVGYGDVVPVTLQGRITAVVVMFMGIALIGALASLLASMLVSPAPADEPAAADAGSDADPATAPMTAVEGELARTRADLGETRAELGATRAELAELRRLIVEQRQG